MFAAAMSRHYRRQMIAATIAAAAIWAAQAIDMQGAARWAKEKGRRCYSAPLGVSLSDHRVHQAPWLLSPYAN